MMERMYLKAREKRWSKQPQASAPRGHLGTVICARVCACDMHRPYRTYVRTLLYYATNDGAASAAQHAVLPLIFKLCIIIHCSTLKDLLERTIVHGEGNSLLIIGPRGCGKSWVGIYIHCIAHIF